MVAKDGLPFSVFSTSMDLRRALKALNFERKPKQDLPTCNKSIRSMVMKYSKEEKDKKILEVLKLKETGIKFAITFDEWTSSRNRRYSYFRLAYPILACL